MKTSKSPYEINWPFRKILYPLDLTLKRFGTNWKMLIVKKTMCTQNKLERYNSPKKNWLKNLWVSTITNASNFVDLDDTTKFLLSFYCTSHSTDIFCDAIGMFYKCTLLHLIHFCLVKNFIFQLPKVLYMHLL